MPVLLILIDETDAACLEHCHAEQGRTYAATDSETTSRAGATATALLIHRGKVGQPLHGEEFIKHPDHPWRTWACHSPHTLMIMLHKNSTKLHEPLASCSWERRMGCKNVLFQ